MSTWPDFVREPRVPYGPALAEALVDGELGVAAIADLERLGFTAEELATLVINPRTLRHRRSRGEPLSADEADRAVRLARTWAHALDVFGERARAWLWLRAPNRVLDGRIPVQLLRTETGGRLVEEALVRLEHGIFA